MVRPRVADALRRDQKLGVRLTARELERVTAAAVRRGESVVEFLRQSGLEAAARRRECELKRTADPELAARLQDLEGAIGSLGERIDSPASAEAEGGGRPRSNPSSGRPWFQLVPTVP